MASTDNHACPRIDPQFLKPPEPALKLSALSPIDSLPNSLDIDSVPFGAYYLLKGPALFEGVYLSLAKKRIIAVIVCALAIGLGAAQYAKWQLADK